MSEQPITDKKDKSSFSNFISGFAGGLVAVLLVGGIFWSLSEADTNSAEQQDEPVMKQTEGSSIPTTNITYEETNSVNAAVEQVSDAVVGVSNISHLNLWEDSETQGTGSGVIYKKEDSFAYVVTNNHVVEGAQAVEVILSNGEHVEADILGTDALTDLAVLRIPGDKVETVATLGSSDDLNVGDTAVAIGNPLGTEFAGSVTKGIISGLDRAVDVDTNGDRMPDWTTNVIQTDAAINPGNSGGALINAKGELIGINSMKIALTQVEGIGFAIPIDEAKPVMDQLETSGEVVRPYMGISGVDLSSVPARHARDTLMLDESVEEGIVLAQVQPRSPSDEAGLQRYDVITKIDDTGVSSMLELKSYLYRHKQIGDEVTITFYREGKLQTTKMALTEQENI
ncbi:serine protease Do [Gracilibacillus halotolerans]|uniref:Serine protease Do n=1 Tax=Gracilibacillus halotolerans TaxID=74386 RepID=A0A841RND0_9BACI|nr:S1C family serine protease [Gracilibacillus halotolerans]MBB6513123.1 serine protease Do [Gracilibacillus halotolerans]